jgi:hypothetical protein
MYCIEANCATASLQGRHALRFFRSLCPTYSPPSRLAFMRIVRLLDQAVLREYRRIIADNVIQYGMKFASTNSDFYTNKERRESFGCLVANTLAQQYVFEVSRLSVFVLLYFFCSVTSICCIPISGSSHRMDESCTSVTRVTRKV